MAAAGLWGVDGARNGKHLPPLLGGGASRDQRAGCQRRLNHQGAAGQPRDDAVALGEVAGNRRCAQRELAEHESVRGNLVGQLLVLARVDPVHPGADDSDGRHFRGVGGQGPGVRGGVDAQGHARDDAPAHAGQAVGKLPGVVSPLGRGVAGANHRQAAGAVCQWLRALQPACRPGHIQHQRGIGNVQQAVRVADVAQCDQGVAATLGSTLQPLPGGGQGLGKSFGRMAQLGGLGQADAVLQLGDRGLEDGGGGAETCQQAACGRVAHAGREGQAQPGFQLRVFQGRKRAGHGRHCGEISRSPI